MQTSKRDKLFPRHTPPVGGGSCWVTPHHKVTEAAPSPALRGRPDRKPEAEDQAAGGPAGVGRCQVQAGEGGPGEGRVRLSEAQGTGLQWEGRALRGGVTAPRLTDGGLVSIWLKRDGR